MIVIVMGVSGSGKSTLGRPLAERLGWAYLDADEFHPPSNIAKMHAGQPLGDADRAGWLTAMGERLAACAASGESAVLGCSALKRAYRDQLRAAGGEVRFVYLRGSYELIAERLARRTDHFMPPGLLASQFAALEEPDEALTVDIARPPEEIIEEIYASLR